MEKGGGKSYLSLLILRWFGLWSLVLYPYVFGSLARSLILKVFSLLAVDFSFFSTSACWCLGLDS